MNIEATERAGLAAGLTKVKLLREPEAAALAYGLTQEKPQIVLVFDLGGGTFFPPCIVIYPNLQSIK